ncbi:sulfotransferase family protein [Azospirillum sp. B506]|uniref:sulfotransferase family protein n=1 Tax=Azospirillum sp. B506 TaxID=137721 RepID=UPI0019022481|nr:sulfotransferase family protein [Azospirillum sp. B506]
MSILTTRFGDLNRLSELMKRDDPSISTSWLEPDGKYQLQRFRLDRMTNSIAQSLGEGFRRIPPDQFPTLYYGWGRCRVGSTALANLFGVAGLPAYFQPVKAAMRNFLTGCPQTPWVPPSSREQPCLFSKEVAGPYLMAECLFIPLQILIEAGYPADRLHLILLDREPALSLASWFAKWSDRVPRSRLLKHFVIASLNAARVEAYAAREGVRTTHYVHEASRQPEKAAAALFRRLGLSDRFFAGAVTDWNGVEEFTSDRSSLIFTKEPDVYFVPGVHRAGSSYRYLDRDPGSVSDDDLALLDRMGIPDLYRSCAEACARELGISLDQLGPPLTRLPDPAMLAAQLRPAASPIAAS